MEDRDETLISSLKDVCRSYPVDNEMFSKTHTWFDYVSRYVELYIPLFENYGREELFKKQQEGTLKTYYMENAGRVLSAKQLAFFKSSSIYFTSLQQQFPKEITAIYEQMLKEYPRNPWKHYLTSYAADVQAYHSIIEKPFGEGVIFVENYSEINFLREVVALFKGKKVYIDVWVTWCAPCKSEFQHKQALKEYLQETDTEIVYISFDEDDRDTTWQEMIKYYGLDGYHLRVNPALRADLFVQYDNHGRIAIPWYILFDEEGNIMEKHAPAPSEIATGRK
ncbi:MAG: TlpA family protein disulfide reductase [Tannerellaceae bacterium]|nr:TlpA family protein disulfide reductase [Tannerellaceae bacterium]